MEQLGWKTKGRDARRCSTQGWMVLETGGMGLRSEVRMLSGRGIDATVQNMDEQQRCV